MIFMALYTSLLLQKIVWTACHVGETIFGCKLLRVYCQIQLPEAPMPSKD